MKADEAAVRAAAPLSHKQMACAAVPAAGGSPLRRPEVSPVPASGARQSRRGGRL
jgi:hypothetical protein